jgi:hypothetical protein
LTGAAVLFALLALGGGTPFPYDPRVLTGSERAWSGIALAGLGITYFLSLLGTLTWQGRESENDAGLESSTGKSVARLKRAA